MPAAANGRKQTALIVRAAAPPMANAMVALKAA
jgi:hypothetical protein